MAEATTNAPDIQNNDDETRARHRSSSAYYALAIPILSVFTALVIGAILIVLTDSVVMAAWGDFFSAPGAALSATWKAVALAYGSLLSGSLGVVEIWKGVGTAISGGGTDELARAMVPLAESLTTSVPFIFAGLAVAVGFQGGLFNIGVEGQLLVGALSAVFVGYTFTGLPWYVHLPMAILAGMIGGAIWGGIPGLLKAYTGGHEVINTIMMNWIAIILSAWLLKVGGPMARPDLPLTPPVLPSAQIPQLFSTTGNRFHAGFFLALIVVAIVWWLLYKATTGFEIRMSGANPHAATYSGINVKRTWVFIMALGGALAGLAGTVQALAVDRFVALGFSGGLGFDSIALALLGRSHPVGVLLAALLFGTLRNGATRMQSVARIPIDIVTIVQALVIVFIAAPEIIRWIYRLRAPDEEAAPIFTTSWGS
ncbi:MAG: ABC transporter permease [Caldilineales bacterium]|nr:ABC transporter permease [Caldilineales bacterium]